MEEVNIRIKSPSSVSPDLHITCDINKNVLHLKEKIQEKYESRPAPGEQKLVYSGKLLQDNQLLREFLRFEDECSLFTIHLVCKLAPSSNTPSSLPTSSLQDGVRNRSQPLDLTSELSSQPVLEPVTPELVELDSIRRTLDSLAGTQGNLTQTEVNTIQELYNQYIALCTQYNTTPTIHPSEPEERRELLNPPPHPPAEVPQLPGQPGEEVEPGNNDVLDYAYAIIRVIILLCVIYAHSNFFRLLFVVGGMGLIFILQGRNRVNQEVNNNQENNVNPQLNEGQDELSPDEGGAEDNLEETNIEPKPHILMVAFTFVSSLITSVIPDHTNLI